MKKTFMKSLMAFCAAAVAMTAVSTSCGKLEDQLNSEVADLQGQIDNLDDRLTAVEQLTAKLEALTLRVDALYTLKFSVSESDELLYSFDGGQNWVNTGVTLVNADDVPAVTLVDNGPSVTITVNEEDFTIVKPLEVEFEVKGGRVFFQPGETKTIALKTASIEEMFVIGTPEGWSAKVVEETLEIAAPAEDPDYYGWGSPVLGDQTGLVKVAGVSADGRVFVGKASVCASYTSLAVYAYNDTAYFEVADSFEDSYYYGVSKKADFEADVKEALNAAYNWNTDLLEKYGQTYQSTVVPISHMLGTADDPVAPVAGEEYVVWAFIDSWDAEYTFEEVVYTSYSVVEVDFEVTEAQAYDVQIELNVEGVDSYMAVSIPADQYIGADSEWAEYGTSEENMVSSVQYGQTYGVILKEDYVGSIYEVCANTQFSATGQAGLGKKCYLLVLPLDGRPFEAYTVEDVYTFEGQCAPATQGGSVTVSAEQVYEYDDWGETVEVNKYNDIYLEVTPSEGWYALYNAAFTDEELDDFLTDEELVEYILANSFGMLAADQPAGTKSLIVPFTDLGQEATINYVAFAVDKNGQYSELFEAQYSTSKVEFSTVLELEATAPETITSTDVTITVTTTGTATSYRYVYFAEDNSTWNYSYDADPEAAIMALVTNDYSSWSNPSVDVTAAEWDGTVELSGLEYDKEYYFFVAAWDEDGAPAVAQCTFTPEMNLGTLVAKDSEAWTAAQPTVVSCEYVDGDVFVNVKPVEGTKVAVYANTEDYLSDLNLEDNKSIVKGLFNTIGTYYRTVLASDGTNVFGYYKFSDTDGDGVWTRKTYASGESIKFMYAVQLADGSYCEPVVMDVEETPAEEE